MAGLRIGTAGVPASTKPQTTPDGIVRLAELGLEHMEIEFVRGVRMGERTARAVRKLAEEQRVSLTVHAPYYINLNSKEPEKVEASKQRIIQAAKIGAAAGRAASPSTPLFTTMTIQKWCMSGSSKIWKRCWRSWSALEWISG